MRNRRVIIWREGDRTCVDCGRPTRYGRSGSNGRNMVRCMACEVARGLRDWRYTGTYAHTGSTKTGRGR